MFRGFNPERRTMENRGTEIRSERNPLADCPLAKLAKLSQTTPVSDYDAPIAFLMAMPSEIHKELPDDSGDIKHSVELPDDSGIKDFWAALEENC